MEDLRGFLALFVDVLAELIILAILIRVILSWIKPMGSKSKFFMFLFEITEPVLSTFRRFIPRIGMIDISPIIALFVIQFIRVLIIDLLL
jgi:YggT family protein